MTQIMRNMDKLGFAESTCGTTYIREAVKLAAEYDRAMMCKDIYPRLSRMYATSPTAIERAMRTAIEKAMRSPSFEYAWREMGGWGKPSNAEMIFRLLRFVKYED